MKTTIDLGRATTDLSKVEDFVNQFDWGKGNEDYRAREKLISAIDDINEAYMKLLYCAVVFQREDE